MPRVLRTPRLLWTIVSTAAATNQRVTGITGANPLQLKPYYTGAIVSIAVTANVNYTLTRVAILGSMDGLTFPAPGGADTLLTTATNIGIGTCLIRAPFIFSEDLLTQGRPTLLPEYWLVEYSGTIGATPTITIEIRAAFIGGPPFAVE